MRTHKARFMFVLAVIVMLAAFPLSAGASHSWGNYHWARTSNPFTVKVIDSMTASWDDNLDAAIVDWDSSSVMNITEEPGSSTSLTRRRCAAVSGKVRACNYTYGATGWSGLATIWVSGSHIVQGIAKMNDTYLSSSNITEVHRQHVICQEIGHDWGLGHQDETGADLGTCMDYATARDNPDPNAGDFDQLLCIYDPAKNGVTLTSGPHTCTGTGHLDSTTTIASMPAGFANADVHAQENWGEKVSDNGKTAIFVRDFGNDNLIVTFVIWVTE